MLISRVILLDIVFMLLFKLARRYNNLILENDYFLLDLCSFFLYVLVGFLNVLQSL